MVDDEDFEVLSKFKWQAKQCGRTYYAQRAYKLPKSRNTKSFSMHRQLLDLSDPKLVVDHKDGNGLNNCRYNLRVCTIKEISRNRKPNKSSSLGYKGVYFNKEAQKWVAQVMVNLKSIRCGFFDSPEEAAHAYNEAAKLYHGEFARLNELGDYTPPVYTKRRNSLSGYRGVYFVLKNKRSWRAVVRVNKKPLVVGSFSTPEDAARAYNEAAKQHHGDKAKLNKV